MIESATALPAAAAVGAHVDKVQSENLRSCHWPENRRSCHAREMRGRLRVSPRRQGILRGSWAEERSYPISVIHEGGPTVEDRRWRRLAAQRPLRPGAGSGLTLTSKGS